MSMMHTGCKINRAWNDPHLCFLQKERCTWVTDGSQRGRDLLSLTLNLTAAHPPALFLLAPVVLREHPSGPSSGLRGKIRRRVAETYSETSCDQNCSALHICGLTFALSDCWSRFSWGLNCKQKLLCLLSFYSFPISITSCFCCSKSNVDQKARPPHWRPIFSSLKASSCHCLLASGFDFSTSSFPSSWVCAEFCLLSESWRRWSIPLKNNNFIFLPVWHDDISLSYWYRNRKAI